MSIGPHAPNLADYPKHNRVALAPETCTEIGTYGCTVPTHAHGKRIDVDRCVADIVAALNAANIRTVECCCGHGSREGYILIEDGRVIRIGYDPRYNFTLNARVGHED